MKLSICMMVKDEEKNLRRCLNSVKPLIEEGIAELIIVDTGSSDNTVDIVKEYTDKVYFHLWNNDFSSMRNISISYARGEWIFILDADEEVENVEELRKVLLNEKIKDSNTLILEVKNIDTLKDKDNIAYSPSTRIFKNDGQFKYIGAVHNQPVYKEPTYNTKVSLVHYGYILGDKELMDKKFLRTTTILESELKKDPNNVYYLFQLGVSYDMHGDFREGLEEFKKAYNILKTMSNIEIYDRIYVYGAYARCCYANGKYNEAINICKQGIEYRHDYIDLYFMMAMAEKHQGDLKESKKHFLKYFELINNFHKLKISEDLNIILYNINIESKDNAYYNLSEIYMDQSDYEKAHEFLALIKYKIKKNSLMPRVLVRLNDISKLKKYYNEIKEDEGLINYFLSKLELEINKLTEEEQYKIYRELGKLENEYSLYCKIKILKDEEKVIKAKEFLKTFDFRDKPLFYSEIFRIMFNDSKSLFNYFKKINLNDLKDIVKYLLDNYDESKGIFKELLLDFNIKSYDISGNKAYIGISYVILINEYQENKTIYDIDYGVFKRYIDSGINYVLQLYNMEKVRIIYKEVSSSEERFFMLMYLIKEHSLKNDIKSVIRYIKEALNCNRELIKYIGKYKDEILRDMS
ncbi:glycosyltransferase [Clostridium botulinum]|nr:glycosyltransferase [Clostridium botulinum]NFI18675.1 glycosyltransferase [Clostridium botulinum]NFI51969.1 glycosyltransferase [Clostridium botulinum]NFL92638.1 glycosyltransferase [Clostridium botulinum]NFN52218.1 glycosyltransferase [Clostridium botulinum]